MRRALPGSVGRAATAVLALLAAPAAAQSLAPLPVETPGLADSTPAPIVVTRPRFSVAIGLGSTFDDAGFTDGRHAIPAFFAVGGAGDGLLGVDFLAFASSASGRFQAQDASPVDRLGMDAFGVLRPAGRFRSNDRRYGMRVLRTLAAELGLGLEREGRRDSSGSRFAIHTGGRFELPLTPATDASELRLRLAVRRDFGLFTPSLDGTNGVTAVGDTGLELYGALALIF
jgi:hypothetical protein